MRAGFPSPAEDFHVDRLDLAAILVTHPQATFLLRLRRDSMKDAGLFDGDHLVVNRALKPVHQDVVVAVVGGVHLQVLWLRFGRDWWPRTQRTLEIRPKDGRVIEILGVVTASIKRFRGRQVRWPCSHFDASNFYAG